MSVELARSHYLGKDGCAKLNCAQSVAGAFQGKFALSDEAFQACRIYGGGRAPNGECGALYAAKLMLEKAYPAMIKDCEDALLLYGGSTQCHKIRSARRLSCLGCVETVAACLERA